MEGPVIPAFEIIATVASSEPGEDGNYSAEADVEQSRPWVEAAGEAGLYVLLDLQPGRTDFLTQGERYRPLLELPNVGLALDPGHVAGRARGDDPRRRSGQSERQAGHLARPPREPAARSVLGVEELLRRGPADADASSL